MFARVNVHRLRHCSASLYTTLSGFCTESCSSGVVKEICRLVSTPVGGLDELEASLKQCEVNLSPSLVVQVVEQCKDEAHTRRLLRFFTWSCKSLGLDLEDKEFNHAIRVFAERKDHRAVDLLLSDLRKHGRVLETKTFGIVAEVFVKLGRVDDALGIFKNLELFKCGQDKTTVAAIVNALCAKGHARRAEGVLYHHKDKISGVESCVYKSILYGWSMQANVKEARRILQEMKSKKITLDLYCFNTFLRCLCEHNLKTNPSGLVSEALNVMMEMRTYKIIPNTVSYNVLLSCLGRTRRVKESLKIFSSMRRRSGCAPDWASYYLVARVMYLTGRFGKGNQIVDMITEKGLVPPPKFYYDLIGILCGVERVVYALELLDRMKKTEVGSYGPVYDVLIPKLCIGGDFEKGKELWDEAEEMGIVLQCSRDILDPSKTKVFLAGRKEDQVVEDHAEPDQQIIKKKPVQNAKKKRRRGSKRHTMNPKKKAHIMKRKKKSASRPST